jgi:hypothetical protein
MRRVRNFIVLMGLTSLIAMLATEVRPAIRVAAPETLPDRLSDEAFWQLIADLSEPTNGETYPGGDNFTTNESGYQEVIPELLKVTKPGGVYFGVAPEQNFTYIAALRPKIAFIIDIRRQNMMEHLLYKTLFEMADNRADFLSLLFDRKRPDGLNARSSAQALFDAYRNVQPDRARFEANLQAIKDRLTQRRRNWSTETRLLQVTTQAFRCDR